MNGDDSPNPNHDSSRENSEVVIIYPDISFIEAINGKGGITMEYYRVIPSPVMETVMANNGWLQDVINWCLWFSY